MGGPFLRNSLRSNSPRNGPIELVLASRLRGEHVPLEYRMHSVTIVASSVSRHLQRVPKPPRSRGFFVVYVETALRNTENIVEYLLQTENSGYSQILRVIYGLRGGLSSLRTVE